MGVRNRVVSRPLLAHGSLRETVTTWGGKWSFPLGSFNCARKVD